MTRPIDEVGASTYHHVGDIVIVRHMQSNKNQAVCILSYTGFLLSFFFTDAIILFFPMFCVLVVFLFVCQYQCHSLTGKYFQNDFSDWIATLRLYDH